MEIVIATFIGLVLVAVLINYILNLKENLRTSNACDDYHRKYVGKYFDMMKECDALKEKNKELQNEERYWYAKYWLATEKKLSRAKFNSTNRDYDYTDYCKLFEERIEAYKETITKYEEDHKRVTWIILTLCGEDMELSGTKLQKELFEKKYKEKEEEAFPRFPTKADIMSLAISCGVSVTTETTK